MPPSLAEFTGKLCSFRVGTRRKGILFLLGLVTVESTVGSVQLLKKKVQFKDLVKEHT